jgi:hypothetical protein
MNMWADAFDAMNAIDSGPDSGKLNVDQQLKLAQIKALLSISQELSKIQDEGISQRARSGD